VKYVVGILVVASIASPLRAQDPERDTLSSAPLAAERPYRDPHRARVLGSIIPGAGHIYAGEYLRGIGTYETTVLTIGMGVMVYYLDNCTFALFQSCKPEPAWPHQLLGIAGVGAGLWTWISSARDASRAAERANERHRRRLDTVRPILSPGSGPSHVTQVGVSLEW
jgi:hypothetical protein